MTIANDCPLCAGNGWRFVGDGVVRCSCRRAEIRLARIRAVLPPLYENARLVDFKEALCEEARRWLKQPGYGLLLHGPTGVGKTHLAAALTRALIEAGKSVAFKSAADYYAELRGAFHGNETEASEVAILRRITDAEFAVLDDVGSGSMSDHERRVTLHLLDRRLNHLRPTIITTNLLVEQIGHLLDARVASRLAGFHRIAMTGRDRRIDWNVGPRKLKAR